MKFDEIETRVRFYETDEWGMVWHGYYVGWFEMGRIEIARKFDLLPKQFKELGYVAPVINLNVDYKQVTKSDEEIIIKTHFEEPQKAALKFKYEIARKEDGELLSRGETTQVIMTTEGKLIYIFPDELKERIMEMARYCK